MDQNLLIFGLIVVTLAWLAVIWYLYRYYSAKQSSVGKHLGQHHNVPDGARTYQLHGEGSENQRIGESENSENQKVGESDHSEDKKEFPVSNFQFPVSSERDQKEAEKIIDQAVDQAKRTLEDTEYFKKDIADEIEKSLREVEENTSRLLEGESEALDQQYKNLLAQMQDAIVKARETLVNTEYIREDFIKELESNLNKVGIQLQENLKQQSTEMASQYNELLKDVREDYLKQSEKQSEEFEKAAEAELNEFQEDLKKNTVRSEQEMETQVKARFQQIQQELEAYRADQMKKIIGQTQVILEDITRRVLGDGLNLAQHEQLIMQSIEEAKKEGLFRSST